MAKSSISTMPNQASCYLNWQEHPEHLVYNSHLRNGIGIIPRPKNLERLHHYLSQIIGVVFDVFYPKCFK